MWKACSRETAAGHAAFRARPRGYTTGIGRPAAARSLAPQQVPQLRNVLADRFRLGRFSGRPWLFNWRRRRTGRFTLRLARPGPELTSRRLLDDAEQVAGRVADAAAPAAGVPLVEHRLAIAGVEALQGGQRAVPLLRLQPAEAL